MAKAMIPQPGVFTSRTKAALQISNQRVRAYSRPGPYSPRPLASASKQKTETRAPAASQAGLQHTLLFFITMDTQPSTSNPPNPFKCLRKRGKTDHHIWNSPKLLKDTKTDS